MRKTLAWKVFTLLLVMSLLLIAVTACGSSDSSDSTGSDQVTIESSSGESDSGESDSGVLSPEFKKTFDHYCEVMKKYNENPSDMELLSEMSELISEEAEMLEQMENMDQSEMNTAELAYYLEVTARIEKNLLEVAS